MTKPALLDWATQECLLEASEGVDEMTKKELVAEILEVQLATEIQAEQASGDSDFQVVVEGEDEDDEKPTKTRSNESYKTAYDGSLVTSEGVCGKKGGPGGSYGRTACQAHYDSHRKLVKGGMTVEDAQVEAAALALLSARPGRGVKLLTSEEAEVAETFAPSESDDEEVEIELELVDA